MPKKPRKPLKTKRRRDDPYEVGGRTAAAEDAIAKAWERYVRMCDDAAECVRLYRRAILPKFAPEQRADALIRFRREAARSSVRAEFAWRVYVYSSLAYYAGKLDGPARKEGTDAQAMYRLHAPAA